MNIYDVAGSWHRLPACLPACSSPCRLIYCYETVTMATEGLQKQRN